MPRFLRLARPASIQRVIAAKISDGRLLLSPRTLRTSEALNCFGICFSTSRQFIRPRPPPPLAAAALAVCRAILPPPPSRWLRRASSCLRRRSSFSLARICPRRPPSTVRAWRCIRSKAEVTPPRLVRGINSLLVRNDPQIKFNLHNRSRDYKPFVLVLATARIFRSNIVRSMYLLFSLVNWVPDIHKLYFAANRRLAKARKYPTRS